MIKGFSDYLVEQEKTIFVSFYDMNPPSIHHEKIMGELSEMAGRTPYHIYMSCKQLNESSPLDYTTKLKHARKMFPKHARSIIESRKIKNILDIARNLYENNYKNLVVLADKSNTIEFKTRLEKYNGISGRHGFYEFNSIKVVESKHRTNPKCMLSLAESNDFTAFSQELPTTINTTYAKRIFNDVRSGMGLEEQSEFARHIQLEKVSDTREKFVQGKLFDLGDEVMIKETTEVGTISVMGANYVIVEMNDGKRMRKWLDDVVLVDGLEEAKQPEWGTPESTAKAKSVTPGERKEQSSRQDPDISDRKGTQPARYHKGLSKATKVARDRQFKKQAKMADDDPKAYKMAPGDKQAKTKPSKHTKFVKKMLTGSVNEASFADKSKASGISVDTLKKVYRRGVAAWKSGHRPGTTPEQWGHARVNAFISKKKKGGLNHDKDLA